MLIEKIIDLTEINDNSSSRKKDTVFLEWYELAKKVLRKTSQYGLDVGIKLPLDSRHLRDGDIIFVSDDLILTVSVNLCKCLSIIWNNPFELAKISYETGNRHAPLFISQNNERELLIPYDPIIFDLFKKQFCHVTEVESRLTRPLSSNIAAHSH
ncbi:MAG TPA: hypothetical protein DD381_10100 [Lentisphaeria bacterium]|nr:MAG: hypothetical protein A2X47_11875 [Lentisphaerae bacterium GWF2_38_69]HBM16676.1 hypothetical protein [Lentisphaeria bacterium]